jgi:hypothetical protein
MRGGCDDQKKMLLQQEEEEDEAAAAKSGQNKGSCGRRRRRRKDSMDSPPSSSSSYVYQILHLALLAVIIFFFHTFSPTFASVQSSFKLKASTQQQFSCLLAVLSAADPTLISATTFLSPTSQQQQQQQLPSISGSSAIDEQALLEFKQAVVQGSGDLLASWVVGGGSSSNLCSWEGVVCDSGGMGRVVGLLLPNSALMVSYLPAALGNLSELATLNLSNNDFNQSHIPVELSLCSKLEFLDLSNTNLSGSIPPQLGNSLLSLKVCSMHGSSSGWIDTHTTTSTHTPTLNLQKRALSYTAPHQICLSFCFNT